MLLLCDAYGVARGCAPCVCPLLPLPSVTRAKCPPLPFTPPLVDAQAAQIVIGVAIAVRTHGSLLNVEGWFEFESAEADLRGMRGVFLVGLIFAYMGVRNMLATFATLVEKRRYAKKAASFAKKRNME